MRKDWKSSTKCGKCWLSKIRVCSINTNSLFLPAHWKPQYRYCKTKDRQSARNNTDKILCHSGRSCKCCCKADFRKIPLWDRNEKCGRDSEEIRRDSEHRSKRRKIYNRCHTLRNWNKTCRKKRIVVDKVSFLTFPSEIRTSNWEKQPGDMYCVRTVGAAPALRTRLLRSYVPLRCDRVKTCVITIHISRRIFYKSTSYFPCRILPLLPVLYGFRSRFRYC